MVEDEVEESLLLLGEACGDTAAYIAFQLGRKLRFDPATDTFLNDDEANRMRSRVMREPWGLV